LDALLLADRIRRAADLALETTEDQPDLEREYQRMARRPRHRRTRPDEGLACAQAEHVVADLRGAAGRRHQRATVSYFDLKNPA
jgi:hypothetical protein